MIEHFIVQGWLFAEFKNLINFRWNFQYWGRFLPIQAEDELVADSACIKIDERSEEVRCVGPCLTLNVTADKGNRTRTIGMHYFLSPLSIDKSNLCKDIIRSDKSMYHPDVAIYVTAGSDFLQQHFSILFSKTWLIFINSLKNSFFKNFWNMVNW